MTRALYHILPSALKKSPINQRYTQFLLQTPLTFWNKIPVVGFRCPGAGRGAAGWPLLGDDRAALCQTQPFQPAQIDCRAQPVTVIAE